MKLKTKNLIEILLLGIILIGGVYFWQSIQQPKIQEISERKALELANSVIHSECKVALTEIKEMDWNIRGPEFAILKERNICPTINDYRENKMWKAQKPLNDSTEAIALIGIYGKFVCVYVLDKRAAPGILSLDKVCPQKQKVTITTDKREYEQGEVIEIGVRNDLNKSIFYERSVGCGLSFWQMQKREDNNWRNITLDPVCLWRTAGSLITELKPNEEITNTWDLTTGIPGGFIGAGTYRFSFDYGFTQDSWNEKIIYSNEFTIKEK